MVLSLLSGAVSGLTGAAGGVAAPISPDMVTVSPNVTAEISAPFAVGRGAKATTVDPTSDPRAFGLASVAGGTSGGFVLLAAVAAAVFFMARR